MKRPGPGPQRGFTLLELIVAAGILALIAVFSWRGLDALIREREAIASSQAAIDAVQRAFARIERDALLANDVQLDDAGTLRLVAGSSSLDEAPPAAVEYRLAAGTLVRSVSGGGQQGVLDGVASLAIEAWAPRPGGGAWVRSKAAATEAPRAKTDVPGSGNLPVAGPPTGANPLALPPAAVAGALPTAAPLVAAATGIRLSFERADGTRVVRAFMIGGA